MASRVRVSPEGCSVGLIGFPDDLGVRLNGGRAGAAHGPAAFRAALAKYGAAEPEGVNWPTVFDAGDVVPAPGTDAAALQETHRRVERTVAEILERGLLPVGIGGGHDLTLPFVRANIEHWKGKGSILESGVYFDAHLDVRTEAGSGMAFRRLVEQCGVKRLRVHGLDGYANQREHVAWFRANGGEVVASGQQDFPTSGPYFASFDLDVLDASHAPGVSAMNPCGWSVKEAAAVMKRLGKDPGCVCLDIMELCPPHDEGGRTARMAAHLFLTFLDGFASRGGG